MKFLHTGDLHIGKTVYDFSMLTEQEHILKQIADISIRENVDAVVIAGDVYDRPIPPTEAVNVLNNFLTTLISHKIKVLMISGNHDSPERVAFADKILEKQGLFISGTIEDRLKEVIFEDAYGKVRFVLLPFVKPAVAGARSSCEAVDILLGKNGFSKKYDTQDDSLCDTKSDICVKNTKNGKNTAKAVRNILVAHYFVTGSKGEIPMLSDSETTINVGGLEQVCTDSFDAFDYVALGHIHKPQKIGTGNCYYAGSPLKYSFSECNQIKSVNIVTVEKEISVQKLSLTPMHEMRRIKGKLAELVNPCVVNAAPFDDYIQAILTDEGELIDPIETLRSVYPNIMQIQLLKNEQKCNMQYETDLVVQGKTTMELFKEFYEIVKEEPLDDIREKLVLESLRKAGKEEIL